MLVVMSCLLSAALFVGAVMLFAFLIRFGLRALLHVLFYKRFRYEVNGQTVPFAALGLGAVLAMTSRFGLHWWQIDGNIKASDGLMGNLGEFFGLFLGAFSGHLFKHPPWIWYHGIFGTPMWGFQLLVLIGSAALLIRAIAERSLWAQIFQISLRNQLLIWLCLPVAGYVMWAALIYWWPAGVSDQTVLTFLSLPFILGALLGAVLIGFGVEDSGSSPSYRPSQGRRSDPAPAPAEDTSWQNQKAARDTAERDKHTTYIKDQNDRHAARKRQDEKDAAETKRKDDQKEQAAQAAARRRADDLAYELKKKAEDLAYEAKKYAEHEAWKAKKRQEDEDYRNRNR